MTEKSENKNKDALTGSIRVQFYPNEIRVTFNHWERISSAMLELGMNQLYKTYHQLRSQAVYARRAEEAMATKRVEEKQDG